MSKIIVIDAGHGGKDAGAVNDKRYEKNDNLNCALKLEKELKNQGFTVYMTRTSDKDVSLSERSNFERRMKADFFISLHRNSFTTSTALGVENWVYTYTDAFTIQYAQNIMDEINKLNIFTNRGVKKGNYHVCRETKSPACLLELGFISNDTDNTKYDMELDKLVKAIAKGVCKSAGLTYKEPTPPAPTPTPPTTDGKLYRVQVGAFSNKDNAQKLADELKSKGYQAIIV